MGRAAKRRATAVAPVKLSKERAQPQLEPVFEEASSMAVPTEIPTQELPPTQDLQMQPPGQMSTYKKKRRTFMEMVEYGMQLKQQRMQGSGTEEVAAAAGQASSAKQQHEKQSNGSQRTIPCAQPDDDGDEQPTQVLEDMEPPRTSTIAEVADVQELQVTTTPQPKRVPSNDANLDDKLSVVPEVKRRRLSGKQRCFDADILYKHGVTLVDRFITATACPGRTAMPTIILGTPCSSNSFNWQLRVLQKQGDIRIGVVDLPRYKSSIGFTALNGLSWKTEECSGNVAVYLDFQDKGIALFNGKRQQGTRDATLAAGDMLTAKRHGSSIYVEVNGSEVAHVPASSSSSFFGIQFCSGADAVEMVNTPNVLPAVAEADAPEQGVLEQDSAAAAAPENPLPVQDAEVQVTQSLRSVPAAAATDEQLEQHPGLQSALAEAQPAKSQGQPLDLPKDHPAPSSRLGGAPPPTHGSEGGRTAVGSNGLMSALQLPGVHAESMKEANKSLTEHLRATEQAVRELVQRHQQVADVLQALQGIVSA